MSENVVMSFGRHVASEAGLMQCFVARFAVLEVTESPTARRSVLFLVLDHKLNIYGRLDNERLGARKCIGQHLVVVF